MTHEDDGDTNNNLCTRNRIKNEEKDNFSNKLIPNNTKFTFWVKYSEKNHFAFFKKRFPYLLNDTRVIFKYSY